MKLNDPMHPSEEALINNIRETLAAYEEPYEDGAWEKFNAPVHKRRPIFWLTALGGAAAVLILGMFLFIHKTPITTPPLVKKTNPASKSRELKNIPAPVISREKEVVVEKLAPQQQKNFPERQNEIIKPKNLNLTSDEAVAQANKKEAKSIHAPIQNPADVVKVPDKAVGDAGNPVIARVSDATSDKQKSAEVLLKEPPQLNAGTKQEPLTQETKKWAIGIVVAPSFNSTKKVSMGYGMTLGYALTEKLSLQSGVSYNELDGEERSGNVYAMAAASNTGKVLESTEGKFKGIDIPLEIRLQLTKNYYVNAGLSAFAVLNQLQENNYLESKLVQASFSPSGNNTASFVTNRVTAAVPPTEAQKINYIGFYNFSLGYRKDLSKKHSFYFEPFLKIPVKSTATQNLNLFSTGLRLKFGF